MYVLVGFMLCTVCMNVCMYVSCIYVCMYACMYACCQACDCYCTKRTLLILESRYVLGNGNGQNKNKTTMYSIKKHRPSTKCPPRPHF